MGNFIITFVAVADANSYVGKDLAGTYINTNEAYHTDLYAAATDITIVIDAGQWYSTLGDIVSGAAPWTEKVAISSFPQNDLGKDFRFNIRILHKMGEADQAEAVDSYYWYKVNKVTITFPATVGCHWDSMDDSNHGYFRCMDSASGPAVAGNVNPQGGHMSWVSDDDGHTDSTGRTFHESFTTAVTTSGCSNTYSEEDGLWNCLRSQRLDEHLRRVRTAGIRNSSRILVPVQLLLRVQSCSSKHMQ